MERINLTKYGFIRSKEDDFSDDGSYFYCYRVGKVRVSKLVTDDEVYISGRYDTNLPYQEYSKLPHYQALNELNGVSKSEVTEEALQELYEACISYQKEADDAYANYKFPTFDEMKKKASITNINIQRQMDYIKAKTDFDLISKMDKYDRENLFDWYRLLSHNLISEEYLLKQLNSTWSVSFMEGSCVPEVGDNYWFTKCLELIQKYSKK